MFGRRSTKKVQTILLFLAGPKHFSKKANKLHDCRQSASRPSKKFRAQSPARSPSLLTGGFRALSSPVMVFAITSPVPFTSIMLAVGLGLATARAQVLPEEDYHQHALIAAGALQQWYNPQGLWDTTGWWNAANCLDALESVITAENGGPLLQVIPATYERNSGKHFLNDFYDDEGWWALAWLRAYDLTGDPRYLATAQTIFADMTGGWEKRPALQERHRQ
jgi:hypothetical protein